MGSLVGLKDHCDLFFVCEVNITSHLINETPCGPYHYPAKIPYPSALQPTFIPPGSSIFFFCSAPSSVCLSHSLPPDPASALLIILSSHPNVFIFYWKCFPGLLLQDVGDYKINGDHHSQWLIWTLKPHTFPAFWASCQSLVFQYLMICY